MRILLLFLVLLLFPLALEGSECGPISDIDGCSANATYCEPLRFDGSKWKVIVDCPDKLWVSDVQAEGERSPYTEWSPAVRLWCHTDARWHVIIGSQKLTPLAPGRQVVCAKVSPKQEGLLTIMDACPVGRADQLGCTRLGMDKYGQTLCNLNQWWSMAQLIYHAPTRTATVTTMWRDAKEIASKSQVQPRNFMCSTNRPELSIEAVIPGLHHRTNTLAPSRPGYFCPKEEGNGCGNGDCVMVPRKNSSTKICQCHFGWRGPSCDEAYDPFGVGSSDVARVPFRPANAMEDSCNILLIEGCPDEATDDCIKLRFAKFKDRDGEYCPRLLWLSTEKGWKYITKLGCANKQWYYQVWHHETYKGQAQLKPNSRVRCANSRPSKAPLAFRPSPSFRQVSNSSFWMGANLTHLCFRNEIHCKNGGICVHHHGPASTKTLSTYCECPPGFPGEQCESALEVVPRRPNCSLILVEGCPSGHRECKPLQYDEASQSVSCKKILWRSNVQAIFNEHTKTNSYTTKWTRIEKLQCVDDKWHMRFKNGSEVANETVLLNTKVMCSKWTPAVEAHAFVEHSYSATRADFANGSVKPSPLAYCPEGYPAACNAESLGWLRDVTDRKISERFTMHGECVLSYKEGRFTPSCQCNFGWTGDRCDEAMDPYGIWFGRRADFSEPAPHAIRDACHIPNAEGCPDEDVDGCHKLRYFDKGAHCPRKLWVSAGHVQRTGVVGDSNRTWAEQEWEPIDRLECTARGWMIHRSLNGNRTKEPLSLSRRVQCAAGKPTSSVGFWGKEPYFDEDEDEWMFENTKETYCFHESFGRCLNRGHCVLNYEGSSMNHQRCHCRTHPKYKELNYGPLCDMSVEVINQRIQEEIDAAGKPCERRRTDPTYMTPMLKNPC